MVSNNHTSSFFPTFISDKEFDANFPQEIERLSARHWTPAYIAKRAAKFLVNSHGTRVLDIGAGVGKFCVIGGACNDGLFTGVEQRENLCQLADTIARHYNVSNVKFIHANITEVDFSDYDAFFFYNSFFENIEIKDAIDKSIDLNSSLYKLYHQQLTEKLANMPKGTRLVTYWGDWVPPSDYVLVYCNGNDSLKFWEKQA